MAFDLNSTRTLLGVIDRAFPPNPVLINTFFPEAITYPSEYIDIEYIKGGRKMAPFVVPGSKGVNMGREGFETRSYKSPMMRPKRTITADELQKRMAGEAIYSSRTPEQRAEEYRVRDLAALQDMCIRREEYMAAKLLIEGQYTIEGYADDGKTQKIETIGFNFTQKLTLDGANTWDKDTSDAYGNLQDASKAIRRNAGAVPTVMLCSEATSNLLLNNKSVRDKLLIPSRDNLAMMTFAPKIQSPDVIRFGMINSLGLEMYTYEGGYMDDAGEFKQYLPDNYVIIGVPGKGKRLYGAVTQIEPDGQYHTFEGRYVPKVTVDRESDTSSIALSSRCLVVPESIDDWYVIKVK